jgi:hypothetical protein
MSIKTLHFLIPSEIDKPIEQNLAGITTFLLANEITEIIGNMIISYCLISGFLKL